MGNSYRFDLAQRSYFFNLKVGDLYEKVSKFKSYENGLIRNFLGEVFHELARQKGYEIVEGDLMADPVPMCISIPPKYAVSSGVGFIKGKSAITIAREYRGKKQRSVQGKSFWARGFFVSTVGLDEETIRDYIQKQEKEDERHDQLHLWETEPDPLGGPDK